MENIQNLIASKLSATGIKTTEIKTKEVKLNWLSIQFIFIIIMLSLFFFDTALAERLSISVPLANIRTGPGTKYDVVWKVEKYFPFVTQKKSGGWYRFKDFEGSTGWVHKSVVVKTSTVITKKNMCNIRSGPSTRFEIMGTAGMGVPFKVIKKKRGWLKVLHADGDSGWIHKTLVW